MTTTFERFEQDFNNIADVVEFDKAWKNGTGYFDNAVHMVELEPGKYAKSTCTDTQRRILFLGTKLGTIAVFERYTPKVGESKILVSNVPRALNPVLGGNMINEDRYAFFASRTSNPSHLVDGIIAAATKL